MVDELSNAKLSFAAHSNPLNCIDALNHAKELQAVLDRISNPIFKEVVRDLGINQAFRRDIFVRGPRKLSRQDHAAALLDTCYALVTERGQCSMRIKTLVTEVQLQANIYEPLLDAFASQPQTGRSLLELPSVAEGGGAARLMQALVVLTGAGYIQPCVPAPLAAQAREGVERFNAHTIARNARGADTEFGYLASPLLASGMVQPRIAQLFLRETQANPGDDVPTQARAIWALLRSAGQALVKDGKGIEGEEANLAEMTLRLAEWWCGFFGGGFCGSGRTQELPRPQFPRPRARQMGLEHGRL